MLACAAERCGTIPRKWWNDTPLVVMMRVLTQDDKEGQCLFVLRNDIAFGGKVGVA